MLPGKRQGLACKALDELTFSVGSRSYPGDHEKGDALWMAIPEDKREEILALHKKRLEVRSDRPCEAKPVFTNEEIGRIFALRRELAGKLGLKK